VSINQRLHSENQVMKRTALLIAVVAVFAFLLTSNFASRVDASKDKRRSTVSQVGKSDGKAGAPDTRAPNRSTAPTPVLSRQDKAEPPLIDLSLSRSHSFIGKIVEVDQEDFNDPDLPAKKSLRNGIDEEEYHRLRDEYIANLRGLDPERPFAVGARRSEAINRMNEQMEKIRAAAKTATAPNAPLSFADWAELGPTTLANGQYQGGLEGTVNGRATAVVVDPTDSNTIYLGTAQGGVWRSTNGGLSWTAIFDTAQSLAIGSIALAPSSPTTLYVGTGEPNNSGDSFFGVGVYRIDNAKTTPVLNGPINPSITTGTTTAITYNCFTGRSITKILVDPTNAANIFVSTATGIAGAGGNALSNTIPPLALRGVFRSTNATAAPASVTFSKLIVNTDGSLDAPGTGNTSIFDMVLDPGFDGGANQILLVSTSGTTTGGVIMRSTNALAATPTFTQTLFPGFNGLVMKLAINKVGAVVTAYVATNEPSVGAGCGAESGRVRKSIDGGLTWSVPLPAAEGYCGGQCSYDNPIAVDPTDANVVYLGGNARGTCSDVLQRSADGGTTFTRDDTNLHADAHYIFIDPNVTPHKVWFAQDGGIYSRIDAVAATPWTSNNNAPLGVFQFVSVAVHPTDQNFTIGGTQDNGTEAQQTSPGNWTSAEGGDGGFALIDQSATDTGANLKAMYHTFFNQTNSLIGFDRAELGSCLLVKNSWEFRGVYPGQVGDPTPSCDGTAFDAANGIVLADTVLFYAPMALGPGGVGNPNTLYFGTNKLYRSTDRGDTMVIVSQNPLIAGVAVSAIGISPTDDNVRIVGMRNGNVFATTTGSATLTNTAFPFPTNATGSTANRHIGRVVIDRTNSNTAYVTLAYYTNPATAGQIWRTTNLNSATPTWTVIGNSAAGLPNIPVNAFAVDASDPTVVPLGTSVLYAGTDIGVYHSRDGGATWLPFGDGLPRVAVFDMAIQPTSRILRIATHGRGMWEKLLPGNPTAAPANISGTVTMSDGSPLAGVTMNLSGARSARVITDSNGNYRFSNVDTDNFYTVTPSLVNYHFGPAERSFSLLANKTDAVFTATRDAVISGNAIDTPDYFVRQHYLDFLGREPDEAGFNFWSDQISSCGSDAACVERRTINVSAAYFLSIEFQQTGGLVDGLYRASYGRAPRYAEFMPDTATVARGVVVGSGDWAQLLAANKQAFVDAWVQRADFRAAYGDLPNDAYVDALIAHSGVSFSQSERTALVNGLTSGTSTRANVLRQIAENERFVNAKRNEMFVMMEYFGYLRRDPDESGYRFWLNKLNQFGGNFEQAEMVKAFIVSGEYRQRFAN
jgi:hypothetical protein